MRITEIDTLYAYNWWATERLLTAASGLSDELFVRAGPVPISFGSLRDTLVHMLDTEQNARLRISRRPTRDMLDPTSLSSIAELSRYWQAEATAMTDYLSGLHDEDLDREFSANDSERYPFWQLLVHVLNHSTQHRSEAAVVLTALDRSPGDLDFALFLRRTR